MYSPRASIVFITILDRFAWSTNADDSLVKLRPGIPPTLAVRFVLRFSFVEHCLYLRSHEKLHRLRGEPRRSRKRSFIRSGAPDVLIMFPPF